MRSIWPMNGATSSASTASRPTTNARNTVTTAQVRRITRSTWTTAGFSATAMNTARPTQIRTVRTLASSDTAIVNTNTENSTFAITRSGMSSTTWRGTSPTAILPEARPMVEDTVALPSSARELVFTLPTVPRGGGRQTPRRLSDLSYGGYRRPLRGTVLAAGAAAVRDQAETVLIEPLDVHRAGRLVAGELLDSQRRGQHQHPVVPDPLGAAERVGLPLQVASVVEQVPRRVRTPQHRMQVRELRRQMQLPAAADRHRTHVDRGARRMRVGVGAVRIDAPSLIGDVVDAAVRRDRRRVPAAIRRDVADALRQRLVRDLPVDRPRPPDVVVSVPAEAAEARPWKAVHRDDVDQAAGLRVPINRLIRPAAD